MTLNQIKHLPQYDKSFKKLILKEFELFKTERGHKNIDLDTDNLEASNKEAIGHFKTYFLLRQQSKIEDLLSESKDYVFSDKNISPDRLSNALDGLKKQIDTWLEKIKGENHDLKKHKPKSLKLSCYELFFEYCNKLKHFHNEFLQFLKRHFKDFDFSHQKYFVNIKHNEDTYSSNPTKTPLMTKTEVAEYLKISVRQVTNLENMKHFKRNNHIGNSPRYLRSDIEKYANTRNY
ncbi:helix-turn-helix transcriptional regulator [Gaetbulibacter saemankumensis]|uniref:helix-turn-helix transcriptional regulator n=1 Tax=Gaetbulibacter saemankumensis TaxID=311208 RepID=UPI0004251552|nr:helix-turn-helix domain-containing protein [Gaetbulibacter saemankumensis]